ncbi:MAG: hypothetical protein FJ399_10200 [Verrucomicrobia bacterium]|nr:hypothetical protein [Verrucomicrobiota bacterium]
MLHFRRLLAVLATLAAAVGGLAATPRGPAPLPCPPDLTVENTHGVIGTHAFAIYGRGDRTVIQDCDVLSQGNDTLSLWRTGGGRAPVGVKPVLRCWMELN